MKRLLATVVLAAAATMFSAGAASAAHSAWVILSFDVSIAMERDGSFNVVETISVDFRDNARHGIFREIPVRYDLAPDPALELPNPDLTPADYQRIIEIRDVTVTSATAPDDADIENPGPTSGNFVVIRIGDPDKTVTGQHSYRVAYTVTGALNSFETHDELFWNVTGNDWDATIERATAKVSGVETNGATCYRGRFGSTSLCDIGGVDLTGTSSSFRANNLFPGEGLSIVVGFVPGAIDVPAPMLRERWDLGRAFFGSALAIPLTVVTAIGGLGSVAMLLYRRGRDRITRGPGTVDGRLDGAIEAPRPLFAPRAIPVTFRPPGGLRPAQLGLIIDERVDPVDVSATVVDLAARGFLTIEETEDKVLWWSKTDWRLTKTGRDSGDEDSEPLLKFETQLLDGLFEDGDAISLSDLKGKFASDYDKVRRGIYRDGVNRRWFHKHPDNDRKAWLGAGIVALLASVAAMVPLVVFTHFALAGVSLVVAAIVLLALHRYLPRRTARGSQLLVDTLGFKEFIVTAETGRLEFAAEANLFVEYLPYAVVFGAVDKWAKAFEGLEQEVADAIGGWYVGHYPYGGFHWARFSAGLTDFSANVSASLPTVPASSGGSGFSGGGFSGGGFGGGGGGSW